MVGLGRLGFLYSGASGVSADGSVVVGSSDYAGSQEAFRWTAGGGMVGLGHLPGGIFASAAAGVSADGSVVVGFSYSRSGYEDAFRWTAGTGMLALGNDYPDMDKHATGISGDGSVVVGNMEPALGGPGREAFRWTAGGGIVPLGDLPGGYFLSVSSGVSGDGSVVVGVGSTASGGEAFRWTADGGMVGLGFPPGSHGTGASGVSADGSVIVGNSAAASDLEPFRWTAGNGMQRLWDALLAQGVDPAAGGWSSLTEATAVSADGNTIVGYGTRNGNPEAFVAVVPVVPDIKTYVGPNGGNWSTAGNWNPSGVPTASDQVVIGGGRSVNLSANAIVGALSLTGGATLNLKDHALVVNYSGGGVSPIGSWNGSAYTGVTGLIRSGRNGGTWNGTGLTSSNAAANPSLYALGDAEASKVLGLSGSQTMLWNGQIVDATTVLVKCTYAGDANLDGKLNILDYVRIDQGLSASLTGWSNGDFNYDGKINIQDYVIIDSNLPIQGPPFAGATVLSADSGDAFAHVARPGLLTPPALKWGVEERDEATIDLLA
jgi:probable HAF family extracellular repeat protein